MSVAAPTSPPRVLVVAPLYHTDRGGLGRQAVLLTERLAALGARPLVLTRRMEGLPPRAGSPAVEVQTIDAGRPRVHNYERRSPVNLVTSSRFSLGLLAAMARRRRDYDLIHFHGASLPLVLALPWAKLLGKPVLAKVAAAGQGVEAGDLRTRYGPLGRLLAAELTWVDAYAATTGEIAAALVAEGVPPGRVLRLPNAVEVETFRPPTAAERAEARAALGVAGSAPVVVWSGRLEPRKAVDLLLRACARPDARAAGARLLLVGDGPERSRLEGLARALDISEQARFLGFCSDPWRALWAGDVFALPSLVEGLPNALLEALATGLPVVASRLGGAQEVLGDERCGLLVPAGEEAPLAEALARLLHDPALRARLGAAGAARIAEGYTLEAVAPRYLELYERLVAGRPPASSC